jgi:two-component system nitrogen regulation sensor histidine kinase NtrY
MGKKLAIALTVAAILAGGATYAALTATPPFGSDPRTIYLLLNLDLVLLLLLGAIIARRIVSLWIGRRRGVAGARLHVQLVAVFSVLAVAPAILMGVFSAVFFYVGIQSWFSERVQTALNDSLAVARAYLEEHQQVIRADILAMANDLNREAPRLVSNPSLFNPIVRTQAALRNLTEAIVFDGSSGNILGRSALTYSLEMDTLPPDALQRAAQGDVVMMTSDRDDRVRALLRLEGFVDTYLLVGRLVEASVLGHMETVQEAVQGYRELEGQRSGLQVTLTLIFVVVALLLLLAAVWLGLFFAKKLVTPISALIAASERVRAGDLTARVHEADAQDEIGNLSRAFNRMTSQLESQRRELIEANRQLDLRRRFTETVLAGVSAGVLGLDRDGVITLANRSAAELLDTPVESLLGKELAHAVPEMAELLEDFRRRPGRLAQSQLQLRGEHVGARTLLVRITAEHSSPHVAAPGLADSRGFVITFDDISQLVTAQRKAAWADVARRIAHEIKNPLTPIQLSAERLKRKYLKEIQSDPETFETCTDTIVRQVGDIGRMVDEFSAFARMPGPVMRDENLTELCRQALFLQREAHPRIEFTFDAPSQPVLVRCDGRQLSQALTNLLLNAIDAIEGRWHESGADDPGSVRLTLAFAESQVTIAVEDNGKGLPTADRERLTEPYVTTRSKGTGLGLAIVKKIMEDHGGSLTLGDRPGGGAVVSLTIPRGEEASSWDAPAAEPVIASGSYGS